MKITGEFTVIDLTIEHDGEGIWGASPPPAKFEITLFDKQTGRKISVSGQVVGDSENAIAEILGGGNIFEKVFYELNI